MALKPDRNELDVSIEWFVNSLTGPNSSRMERGGVVCALTTATGTGAGMDNASQAVEYAANPSGRAAIGILVNDFVNLDLSRQEVNRYKDEAQIGTKAVILTKGWVVTDKIDSTSATGTVPVTAYAGASGVITQQNPGGYPTIGRFLTRKDANGFAKVEINLP